MKAAAYHQYGPPEVLQFEDVPKPTPGDREILIRVHATSVTAGDYRLRALNIPSRLFKVLGRLYIGVFKPKRTVLGSEAAGVIDAVGKSVTKFQVGDEVFAFPGVNLGAYAEYLTIAEDAAVALKPANLSLEQAVALPFGFSTALYYLRDLANLQPGQRILINGASGNVGTFAVQYAKHLGSEVHGVCSAANVELVRSLGASRVFDYTKEDFTRSGEKYDVIFDTVGKLTFQTSRQNLTGRGLYLATVLSSRELRQMLFTGLFGSRKVKGGVAPENAESLLLAKELAESGAIKPVIGNRFPFAEIVEAHRYADTGHKVGSVVILMPHTGNPS